MKPYYQDEYATIYHGDCREVLPGLKDIGLMIADPPYGSGLSVDFANRFKRQAGNWWKNSDRSYQKRHIEVDGDNEPFDPAPILEVSCRAKVLWGANFYASRLPDSGGWWVWDKRNGARDLTKAKWPMSEAELAWTTVGKGVRVFRHTWFGLIRDSEQGEHHHPAQKPVLLMKWCIRKTKADGVILDPYMGSGTTLVAAKDMNRHAIGIEVQEMYCEIAAKRLAQEIFCFS